MNYKVFNPNREAWTASEFESDRRLGLQRSPGVGPPKRWWQQWNHWIYHPESRHEDQGDRRVKNRSAFKIVAQIPLLHLWHMALCRVLNPSRNGSPFMITTDGQTARSQIWSWVMSISSESTARTSAAWVRSRASARTQPSSPRQVWQCVTAQITVSART